MTRQRPSRGYSLIELMMTVALVALAAAAAVPTGLTHVEEYRLDSAARYLSSFCYATRSQAVRRATFVAIRFEPDAASADFTFRTYVDGNRNGVRTRDIDDGIDPPLMNPERLGNRFEGVRFGVAAGLTGIDGEPLSEGSDPIRVGSANLLSFNPTGSVTAGTLYVRSDRGQRAIRLLGATGRTRLLSFSFHERRWIQH